jgi:CRP-like cAMP-binding protein
MAASRPPSRITKELVFAAFAGPSAETEDPMVLDRLSRAVVAETAQPGHVIFREGDESSDVHFMSEGRMRLTSPGKPDWIYEGRWVIGTTDVLVGRPRARTAVMETEAHVFRLNARLWFEVVDSRPDVSLNVVVGFAQGIMPLYVQLAPDGGFATPPAAPSSLDVSSLSARTRVLAAAPLLQGVPMQTLVELANAAEVRNLEVYEELFGAGTAPGRVHVVTRGRVRASRRDPDVAGVFGAGSIVGGAVCLGDPDARWSAQALEPAQVISFSVEELFDSVEEHQLGVRAMMGALALERERACDVLAARLGELYLGG